MQTLITWESSNLKRTTAHSPSTSLKDELWTSPYGPQCNAKERPLRISWGRPLPMSSGCRNKTSWGRPKRRPMDVSIWSSIVPQGVSPTDVLRTSPTDVLKTSKYDLLRTLQCSVLRTSPYYPICNAKGHPLLMSWGRPLQTI